ncbi:MAG: hypothetical protein ACXVPQ_05775 [Bacteroidia bacterium]
MLLSLFVLSANAQTLAQNLKANPWFISETPSRPEAYSFLKAKPAAPFTEARFLSNGHFEIRTEEWGDFKFICPYELKKDVVKIYYSINTPKEKIKKENVAHYYRIREQQSTSSFELTPVTEKEFK